MKWVRMLYHDFSTFTRDQEHLISINGLDYVEGSLIMDKSTPNNWRSSFFSPSDQSKIASLITKHGIIYCLEVVKYYGDLTVNTVDEVPKFNIIIDIILSFTRTLLRVTCWLDNVYIVGGRAVDRRAKLSSRFRIQKGRFVRRFSQSSTKRRAEASGKRIMGCSSSMVESVCAKISDYGFQ